MKNKRLLFLGIWLLLGLPLASWAQDTAQQEAYEGDTRRGQRHGKGTFTWADGARYTGEWRYDVMHGNGTITWPNGAEYTGEWREGMQHGEGTFRWPDKSFYKGLWRNGKQNGQGTLSNAEGSYEGMWKDGLPEGQGIKLWKDGRRYEGKWKAGKMHGAGFMLLADGEARVGEWKDDEMIPCICPREAIPIETSLAESDAVFLGVVTDIIGIEDGYLAKMEVLRIWKGTWFTNRSIFMEGGFGDCDFVYAPEQIYLVYAQSQPNSPYAGVYKTTRCTRTTLVENVRDDFETLDQIATCKGEAPRVPFDATQDPVCGCDGVTYRNAYRAAKEGVLSWEIGECGSKEANKEKE